MTPSGPLQPGLTPPPRHQVAPSSGRCWWGPANCSAELWAQGSSGSWASHVGSWDPTQQPPVDPLYSAPLPAGAWLTPLTTWLDPSFSFVAPSFRKEELPSYLLFARFLSLDWRKPWGLAETDGRTLFSHHSGRWFKFQVGTRPFELLLNESTKCTKPYFKPSIKPKRAHVSSLPWPVSLLTLHQDEKGWNEIWLKDKMHWFCVYKILFPLQLFYRVLKEKTRPSNKEIYNSVTLMGASQVALVVKNLPANAGNTGDVGSIPQLGRSPEEGHGNPL